MKQKMPRCPAAHRNKISWLVQQRSWRDCTLSKAVGICAHSYIRHRLTDYHEWLDRSRLERDEARIIVKPELDEIFAYWIKPMKEDVKTEL
jgi:hypothetical protein